MVEINNNNNNNKIIIIIIIYSSLKTLYTKSLNAFYKRNLLEILFCETV